jgi:multidrug efflux pump subunit AcrA (membrane-fusion protein)
LKPGSSVQISITARTVPDALTIPAVALLTGQDGTTSVMVAGPDSHAHQKEVKAGIRDGDRIQIVDGLSANDCIVASGAYGLPDNRKITQQENSQSKQEDSQTKGEKE